MSFIKFINKLLPKSLRNNRGSVSFDGIDDKLQRTTAISSSYPITQYCRAKINSIGANMIFSQTNIGSDRNYTFLTAEAGGFWRYLVRDNAGTQAFVDAGTTDLNWHTFVTISPSSNDHRLYLDGVLIGTNTTNAAFPTGLNRVQLGHWVRSSSFLFGNVDISEYAVWSSQLSTDQVSLLNSGIKGTVLGIDRPNLLAYIPLDDYPDNQSVDGLTFRDDSNNGIILTGDDGGNNTGLNSFAESVMSYQSEIIIPSIDSFKLLNFEETVILGELFDIHSNAVIIDESVIISDDFVINPSKKELNINETIELSDVSEIAISQDAPFASKIISINPLIFITDDTPAKISKIDTTDPQNPVATTAILVGIDIARDVSFNSANDFVYIAGNIGQVVKVELADLNNQTIIDVGDTDDLLTIETNSNFGITYAGTENEVGELYVIDERTTFSMDSDFQVIAPMQFQMESDFNVINTFKMDSDFQVLAQQTFQMASDFKCITKPVVVPPPTVSPLDVLEPIKLTDFQVFVNSVELEDTDLILDSISITHSESEQSRASFRLTRKHDKLDTTLKGISSIITNQNTVEIKILGRTEFDGNISELDCQYADSEFVLVNALSEEKPNQFNNITLSLPSLDSRLSLYDILIQNPKIFNPLIDPDDDNPKKFKGIRVNLGQIIKQIVLKKTIDDSVGIVASQITSGSFISIQNWTYFWGTVGATNFGDVQLGDTAFQTFFYIGTSLAPVSEELWNLTKASFHRQRIYDDEIIKLGDGTVAVSDFNGLVSNPLSVHLQLQNKGFLIGGSGLITNRFKKTTNSSELDLIGINANEQTAIYEEIEKQLGFTIGEAPFQDISVRNGIFVPKPKWVDEPDRLSNITDAGNNFVEYAKEVARLEYEKLKNSNGNILPDTSCTFNLTIDAYFYYDISLLTRINIDNTTKANIYNNINGFPVSAKSITITSGDRRVSIEADNIKSTKELEELDKQFPSEDDDEYNEKEKRILIALKSNMKTGLNVE